MKRFFIPFIMFMTITSITCSVYAGNSLITPEGIKRMKEAGISTPIIQLIASQQTCSINADDIIDLKKAGADDETLKAIIMADRYKKPENVALSVERIKILKEAGFSDEAIMQILGNTPQKYVVDSKGNESIIYGTHREQQPLAGTSCEPKSDYNINIEEVEIP